MGRVAATGLMGLVCMAEVTLASSGCGGDGSASSPGGADASPESSTTGDPGRFVGVWARSGDDKTSCQPTLGLFPAPDPGDLTLARGPHAGTLVATQADGCMQTLTVSGNVASIVPGQTCATTSESGIHTVATVVSDALTLAASGQSIDETGVYALVETGGDGGAVTCTQMTRGMYIKQ